MSIRHSSMRKGAFAMGFLLLFISVDCTGADSRVTDRQLSSKRSKQLKVSVLVKRKEGVSFEDFDNYWTYNHGALLASLPKLRHNFLKYTQNHVDLNVSKAANALGFPVADYDGILDILVENWETFQALYASDEYQNFVIPDEQNFVDRSKAKIFFLHEEVHWDNTDPCTSS
ncbi:hypothetical protein Mapa_006759 [Marchantia paleacea]|nr:hypothetical protein Mapa_006759 [Marchantia paleacea]